MNTDSYSIHEIPPTTSNNTSQQVSQPSKAQPYELPSGGKSVSPPTTTSRPGITPTKLKTANPALLLTPPKLIRFPIVVLKQEDSERRPGGSQSPVKAVVPLPPPPPLIKMPMSTRKEKRSVVAVTTASASTPETDNEKVQETPKKRARGERTSESGGTPPTRKIIQEIFGPDKSKRSKGKARKRKRGVTTPKKKAPAKQTEQHVTEADVVEFELPDDEDHEHTMPNEENVLDIPDVKTEPTDDPEVVLKEEEDVPSHIEMLNDDDFETSTCSSRRTSKRKAKQDADEKLKKINEQGDDRRGVSEEPIKEEDDEEPVGPGVIQSRRSTTETSSKSSGSGSVIHADSESSGNYNKSSHVDRQRDNPTPFSMISEDDYQNTKGDADIEDHGDAVSVSDMQDQKDSDVDSMYSWKPVRAAAALATEKVTKMHGGSGSTAGDLDTKNAAAAAERRARKVHRYKGRNRRTLLFKSSSSKQFTKTKNRYSAQHTIIPVVLHHEEYFQTGDIVYVELEDDSALYGQVTGILMDAFGETSAGIRWLSSKSPVYDKVEFDPRNYCLRFDIPEKLIKIEYVNFVMHLHLDYFYGHPSYSKIKNNSIYTRVGKPLFGYGRIPGDEDYPGKSKSEAENQSSGKKVGGRKHDEHDEADSDSDTTDSTDVEDSDIDCNKNESPPESKEIDEIDVEPASDVPQDNQSEEKSSEEKGLACVATN